MYKNFYSRITLIIIKCNLNIKYIGTYFIEFFYSNKILLDIDLKSNNKNNVLGTKYFYAILY